MTRFLITRGDLDFAAMRADSNLEGAYDGHRVVDLKPVIASGVHGAQEDLARVEASVNRMLAEGRRGGLLDVDGLVLVPEMVAGGRLNPDFSTRPLEEQRLAWLARYARPDGKGAFQVGLGALLAGLNHNLAEFLVQKEGAEQAYQDGAITYEDRFEAFPRITLSNEEWLRGVEALQQGI